jgi:hypothetical protein
MQALESVAVSFVRVCSAPQTQQEVLACTDARATLWVGRMSSGCSSAAQPHPTSPPPTMHIGGFRVQRRAPLPVDGPACFGPECFRDPIPLQAISHLDELRSPFVPSSLHLPFVTETAAVFEPPIARPPRPPSDELLRPPRVA